MQMTNAAAGVHLSRQQLIMSSVLRILHRASATRFKLSINIWHMDVLANSCLFTHPGATIAFMWSRVSGHLMNVSWAECCRDDVPGSLDKKAYGISNWILEHGRK